MSTITRSALGYYADFYVYPAALFGLLVASYATGDAVDPLMWIAAVLAGLFLWTLVEYLIHRFVLHNVVYFRDLHDQHHASPTDLIGTPIWISFSLLTLAVLLPSCLAFGIAKGCGFTFGVTAGYLTYSFAHHVLHHWRMVPGHPLYGWKRQHALHHFRHDEGNFGVTTLLWDHVFGTALKGPKPRD